MVQKDFASSRIFFDNKHFPRGFSRSGIFSRKEAGLLERHGNAMKELGEGKREPASDVERRFVKMAQGECEPQTEFEKTWAKYLKQIGTRRVAYTTGMAVTMSDSSDTADFDTD